MNDGVFDPSAYYHHNTVKLIKGGNEFLTAARELLSSAMKKIQCEFYIFRGDEVGLHFAKQLVLAAKRGVIVEILLDGFGSMDLPAHVLSDWELAGVQCRFWRRYWNLGRRVHRKVMVVDGDRAIIGGINVGNEYVNRGAQRGWLDFAAAVEGPSAKEVARICDETWRRTQRVKNWFLPSRERSPWVATRHYTGEALALPQKNYRIWGQVQIYKSYLQAIRGARTSVTIASAYFLPNYLIQKALKEAVGRGVTVKILLSAVSDVPVVQWATRFMYPWLLRSGIRVFEWRPSVLHAKVAVVDRHWATVGSFNLDDLSLYCNLELNLNVLDRAFADHLDDCLEEIMQHECNEISLETLRDYSWWKRALQMLSFTCLRLVARLFRARV